MELTKTEKLIKDFFEDAIENDNYIYDELSPNDQATLDKIFILLDIDTSEMELTKKDFLMLSNKIVPNKKVANRIIQELGAFIENTIQDKHENCHDQDHYSRYVEDCPNDHYCPNIEDMELLISDLDGIKKFPFQLDSFPNFTKDFFEVAVENIYGNEYDHIKNGKIDLTPNQG
tara:strand:+ start:28 stop:549 length:522 start_codon:yes stop_codon:yes gene_type:complete